MFTTFRRLRSTDPKVGRGKSIAGRDGSGGGCVSVEGIDVGQQSGHESRHPSTHVLGGQTREVPANRGKYCCGIKTDRVLYHLLNLCF